MNIALNLAERRIFNDALIRIGIRKLLRERLDSISQDNHTTANWVEILSSRAIAEDTAAANEQHYEVPAPYFKSVLGPHLKYSCGYWQHDTSTLEASETAMLALSCERADLQDGQRILELGCGWGSLSLWMASNYPKSTITAISNSNSQREYIQQQARERGLSNLEVITADINEFTPTVAYDRVVSVEMFEHVRNHRALFKRIHSWLNDAGKIFIHIFAHRQHTYLFEPRSSKDWMSKYFFTGGIMPAHDLLPEASKDYFTTEQSWEVNGQHYSKTLEAWLVQQDAREPELIPLFKSCYGPEHRIWLQRWRIFYMACSELFAYNDGNEWNVMHYRFQKRSA